MKKCLFPALILILLLSNCSESEDKPQQKKSVEFSVDKLSITERSTKRIELTFSEDTEPTDSFIITITNGSAGNEDYELSETPIDHKIVINAVEPYIDLTAIFDALPENDETIELEITNIANGYKIGKRSTVKVTLKNYNIGNNLVGEYLFNGDAVDTNPAAKTNGTVFGASLTTDREGNANQAYLFDGINDYISIPDNDAIDFNLGDYTISMWIDAAAIQADVTATNNFILRKWDGLLEHPNPFGLSLLNQNHPDNPNEFFIETFDGQTCGNSKNAYSGVLTYDGFKHYVLVKSENKLTQYLNGVKISEVTHALTCTVANEVPITIGTSVNQVRFFKGKIDDIRFYNAALDQSRVTELYEEDASN